MLPDGGYIAYESDVSGQYEVYVARYPEMDSRQAVSSGGGRVPVWSADGSELFYRRGNGTDGTVMVSDLQLEPTFDASSGAEHIKGNFFYPAQGARQYDLGPDGRFLMMREVAPEQPEGQQRVVVVDNWFQELKNIEAR
jgi:hypothetical protein